MQESIKRVFNSGLFWAVGVAGNKMQTAISMLLLRSVFFCVFFQGNFFFENFENYFIVRTKKLQGRRKVVAGEALAPQYLADQQTLSRPGGHIIPTQYYLLAPQEFQTLRRP